MLQSLVSSIVVEHKVHLLDAHENQFSGSETASSCVGIKVSEDATWP